jgi:hypothetical protein
MTPDEVLALPLLNVNSSEETHRENRDREYDYCNRSGPRTPEDSVRSLRDNDVPDCNEREQREPER